MKEVFLSVLLFASNGDTGHVLVTELASLEECEEFKQQLVDYVEKIVFEEQGVLYEGVGTCYAE